MSRIGLIAVVGCLTLGVSLLVFHEIRVNRDSAGAQLPDYTKFRNFSVEEQVALDQGRELRIPNSIYLFDPTLRAGLLQILASHGYSASTGYVRNPGGSLFVVTKHAGVPLGEADFSYIRKILRTSSAQILEDKQIPYRFGPDGHTLMVVPIRHTYAPEKYAEVVHMTVQLSFKNTDAAKKAAQYIDRQSYSVSVNGSAMAISFDAPFGAMMDEQDEFERLASQFGGNFVTLNAPEPISRSD
ncbi:MAG: hypothetical protein JST12_01240 [Armatimonadetes bacterium]|nr:hypothetical protein [Armatimonadota bacterium]